LPGSAKKRFQPFSISEYHHTARSNGGCQLSIKKDALRILVLWSRPSGYLHGCLEALASRPEVKRVELIIQDRGDTSAPFDRARLRGSYTRHEIPVPLKYDRIRHIAESLNPHLILAGGSWREKAYQRLLKEFRQHATRVLCMDTQWQGRPRQWLMATNMRLRRSARYDRVFAAGERQKQYALRMGFKEEHIQTGLYACEHEAFAQAAAASAASRHEAPAFLFVGRLIERKGLTELLAGYAMYRQIVKNPWPLRVCGAGPLEREVKAAEGVEYLGFVQPKSLPQIMARHTVLLTPSHDEPWGVVIHEAASAGMGIICSAACGAGEAFVRHGENGLVLPKVAPDAIRQALMAFSGKSIEQLRLASTTSHRLAAAHTPRDWARIVTNFVVENVS